MGSTRRTDAGTARDEAARWLTKLARGLQPDEGAALEEWLRLPAHREAILGSLGTWHGPEVAALLRELLPEESRRPRHRTRRGLLIAALAAAGAAGIVLAGTNAMLDGRTLWSYFDGSHLPRMDIHRTTYVTGPSEKRRVELPDGTVLILNGATKLSVTYSRPWRQVQLEGGEASFKVAADPDWPFTVQAGKREFQTLSGRFDLHALTADLVELTVAQGNVKVSFATPRRPETEEERSEPLTFGEADIGALQTARVYPGFQAVRAIEAGELRARFAWEAGT